MRKILLLFFILSAIGLFAQPINDDCLGIIDLGEGISCTDDIYNNVDATVSVINSIPSDNIPSCWNTVNQDVWFMFTVPADGSLIDYTITIEGVDDGAGTNALTNPQMALYRGDCELDNLAELLCETAEIGETSVSIDAALLTPAVPYFIRVDNFSALGAVNPGAFMVCVDSIMIENNIDDGSTSACEGTLFDSGGSDGDYSSNENNVFTICPSGFNNSVNFTMEFFNTEYSTLFEEPIDIINFFDGDDTNGVLLGSMGGGGTCFQTCAASGCLTVQFVSDDLLNMEGFMGFWECSTEPCAVPQQITTDPTITNADIIAATASPLTQVTIDTIICAEGAIGTFIAPPSSNLGLDQGLILSSGLVAGAPGPNNGFLNNASTGFAAAGDLDLDYLSELNGGALSQDACIVELDVFVNTNELTFEYIFASEEYPEFVNSEYNDIFAFLVSGPGIVGDPNLENSATNIALIPNTNIPVEINAVNTELNWEYYRDNTNGLSINYDGMTGDYPGGKKSLTAKVQTEPCNTYHLKLAIADRGPFGDDIFDSAVFISDIKAGVPTITANFGSGLDVLIEGCQVGEDQLIIALDTEIADSITYTIVVGGTATNGTDYTLNLPSTITFQPGATSFSFPINVLPDAIPELNENVTISLTSDFGCGIVEATTLDIAINDMPEVVINAGADSVFICAEEGLQLTAEGAQFYFWEPVSVFDDPSSNMPTATVNQSQWVTVTGNVGGCVAIDSIFLELIDPEVTIVPQTATDVCVGTPIVLEAINNVNGQGLIWTPNTNISNNTDEVVTITPDFSTVYTASIQIANCIVSDEIVINIDQFDFPELTTTDTTLCQGALLTLANDIFFTNTTYAWSPGDDLLPDSTSLGPDAIPLDDITYTLTATSENGFCSQTASVDVEVIPAEINIMPQDTAFICLGDSVFINATTTTNDITWSSVDTTVNGSNALNLLVNPITPTWYFASFSIGECTVMDSILVQVDSLPNMPITATPEPEYCEGDIVTLSSPTYEGFLYPSIEHLWSPGTGAESDLEEYNFVFTAVESVTYSRLTTNNGCTQLDTLPVIVNPVAIINVTPPQSTICAGETIDFDSDADTQMLEDIQWMPQTGLSCTDCADPSATPTSSTVYNVMGTQPNGCPAMGSASIDVEQVPSIIFPNEDQCVGAQVSLNSAAAEPGTTYSWSSPDDANFSSSDANPVVTLNQDITYSVTADNGICPPITSSITFDVAQEPTYSISPDVTICSGDVITLEAIGSEPGSYTWTPGPDNSSIEVSPTETTTYTSTFTWGPNCGTFTDEVVVTVEEGFQIFLEANPDVEQINQGQEVIMTAIVNPASTNIVTYDWTKDGNEFVGNTNVIMDQPFENPTVYEVTGTSANGCTSSDTYSYVVIPPLYDVPSAFTPNGDNVNDVFNIVFSGEINMESFQVYNRFGQKVFETNDPNLGWDGTQNGSLAPSDVYVYLIKLDLLSGEEILKGDVTLIR